MGKQRPIKILLAGGGSGGHFYPLAVIARELTLALEAKERVGDLRYFGDPGRYRQILEDAGLRMTHITTSKWRAYVDIRNALEPFKFCWGVWMSLIKIFFFMPHVAFSKGGPGTLPIMLACRFYRIPIIVHESDTIPGRSTRALAKAARVIEIAFPEAAAHFPQDKVRVVGNPVSRDILKQPSLDPISKAEFGFNPNQPVILFLGGSQGAEMLNMFVLEHLGILMEKFQILHQVGVKNFESYKQQFDFMNAKMDQKMRYRYVYVPYFEPLAKAYRAADIVISRAGSGTIFELAALGKPALLIPLPGAANDHQVVNAHTYAKTGAAVMIEQDNFLVTIVANEIMRILGNPERLSAMQQAAATYSKPDAGKMIAADILAVGGLS